jgi:hypothetical protein
MLCTNCDLRRNKCLCHFDLLQKKNSQKLSEDGVEDSQKALELYLKCD